jgi:hypothetical protein
VYKASHINETGAGVYTIELGFSDAKCDWELFEVNSTSRSIKLWNFGRNRGRRPSYSFWRNR